MSGGLWSLVAKQRELEAAQQRVAAADAAQKPTVAPSPPQQQQQQPAQLQTFPLVANNILALWNTQRGQCLGVDTKNDRMILQPIECNWRVVDGNKLQESKSRLFVGPTDKTVRLPVNAAMIHLVSPLGTNLWYVAQQIRGEIQILGQDKLGFLRFTKEIKDGMPFVVVRPKADLDSFEKVSAKLHAAEAEIDELRKRPQGGCTIC